MKKLGIFDSGLGGLILTKAIRDHLPDPDIIYLGDTLHLPYGNRSMEAIMMYTKRAMTALFEEHDCRLVVMACNTASAAVLRKLQQEWLPEHYPERNIIGVIVPTLEEALERGYRRIGLIGTNFMVTSGIFEEELKKLDSEIEIVTQATPLLVPLIENKGNAWIEDVLRSYLAVFEEKPIECLILGCTHYAYLKPYLQNVLPSGVDVISQDEIIPLKLESYLSRHAEYNDVIGKNGKTEFYVTDLTDNYVQTAHEIYQSDIQILKTGT